MLLVLRKLRDEAGISQKSLAEAIGVSQQSVNKYENHNIEPDIGTLIRIADFFNISVDYLIGHSSVSGKIEGAQLSELTEQERELIQQYRKLTLKQKTCVNGIIESYCE